MDNTIKKNKYMKAIDVYYKYLTEGKMDCGGLCLCGFITEKYNKTFRLFFPIYWDKAELVKESKNLAYWGSDSSDFKVGEFTSLRQTIVLFIAAIHDEL